MSRKLTEEQIVEIRILRKAGRGVVEIAQEYSVAHTTIRYYTRDITPVPCGPYLVGIKQYGLAEALAA